MGAPNAEKGARYLNQLDTSLCAGAWPDIPEHARKVDKHAPERGCLTLAARAEAQIASASHRPTSASSTPESSIHSLGDLIPKLQEAVAEEQRYAEDVYAAGVCLAEIHWLRGEEDEALEALRRSNTAGGGSRHVTALGWQEICGVRATFIRGAILESKGEKEEARALYLGKAGHTPGSRTPELRRWTDRLIARSCMYMWRRADPTSMADLSDALRCFQAWSTFWQRAPTPGPGNTSHFDVPRREVWRAYYHHLSLVLRQGLTYAPQGSTSSLLMALSDNLSHEQHEAARMRQKAALKQVEAMYESLLLNETSFPKASQANAEVEEWVARVVGNWKILSGSQWSEIQASGEGPEALGRGVLDILYRASTKTFHSTAILRQLFTVHASLGDFKLAMQAFDSYVEIVGKGKLRAEKTGKHEIGFDSDDIAVLTAAEAVDLLCRHGAREQAEKANEVVKVLRRWLGQKRPGSAATVDTVPGEGDAPLTKSAMRPKSLSAAYRAIGTCRTHWARFTYDNDSRERLRADGIRYLRQAQAQDPSSIETSFALALALADDGDALTAIQVIKQAVESSEWNEDDESGVGPSFEKERRLMPLWHLSALCLTVNDEHQQAAKMCEATFEQFGETYVLFGDRGLRTSVDSAPSHRPSRGVIDRMNTTERECLVQVKMTQLALVEVQEGADVAVRMSEELLALYTRVFGKSKQSTAQVVRPTSTAGSATPSKSGGTLRSLAGSIRPRSRSARRGVERESFQPPTSIAEEHPTSATNGDALQTEAPIAITVTNEDGVAAEKQHKHLPFKLRGHHHDNHGRVLSASTNEKSHEEAMSESKERTATAEHDDEKADRASPIRAAMPHDSPTGLELGEAAHNAPADAWPAPLGHTDQPLRQDMRLPVPHPASGNGPQTQLSSPQDRQHRVSLLVEVWLFIAGLYLRADLFDDCAGAVDAAFSEVEKYEEEVAVEDSSARRFFERGWGLGKSVDELWGDVWAAKGLISTSLQAPFAALSNYENCLSYWPDHAEGIIGLSNILMDIYEQRLPAEEPEPNLLSHLSSQTSASGSTLNTIIPPAPTGQTNGLGDSQMPLDEGLQNQIPHPPTDNPSPELLNRLVCRDRAYTLLSTLTKLGLGGGANNSEAWLALARSHELSGQVGRAKRALWWVLKLEEGRGVRGWECVRGF